MQMEEFQVYTRVYRAQVPRHAKILKSMWLDDWKRKDLVRSRLVAKDFAFGGPLEGTFAGTPPLKGVKLIVSLAASKKDGKSGTHRRCVAIYDVSVAFFHADITDWIVVIPPEGMEAEGWGWQLLKAMYGTRKASQLWGELVAKVLTDNGFTRTASCGQLYVSDELDVTLVVHGDDFLAEGEDMRMDVAGRDRR